MAIIANASFHPQITRTLLTSRPFASVSGRFTRVFGAHLRITALRGESGPGIELLDYLAPRDGRAFPEDEHANDIVHRQTILLTSDADAAAHLLQRSKVNFVSSGVVDTQMEGAGFSKGFIIRDPDGHAIEIEQK